MHALLEEESLYVANLPPEKASVRTAENPPWRSPFDRSGNVRLKASDGSGHGVPDLRSFGNIPMGTCSLAASEYRRDCETASFPNLDDSSDTQSSPGLNLTHSLHHFLSILRIWRTYFITMKFCRDAYLWQDWDTFLVQSGDCIDGGGDLVWDGERCVRRWTRRSRASVRNGWDSWQLYGCNLLQGKSTHSRIALLPWNLWCTTTSCSLIILGWQKMWVSRSDWWSALLADRLPTWFILLIGAVEDAVGYGTQNLVVSQKISPPSCWQVIQPSHFRYRLSLLKIWVSGWFYNHRVLFFERMCDARSNYAVCQECASVFHGCGRMRQCRAYIA